MDAQQELFTAIKLGCERLGYAVYDGLLPPEGTPYPFVYIGEVSEDDRPTKSEVFGEISIKVHIYGNNFKRRGEMSELTASIKDVMARVEWEHRRFCLRQQSVRHLVDRTTSEPLMHWIVTGGYFYS